MRAAPKSIRPALLGALVAVAVGIPLSTSPASAASAQEMNGNWAPFTRCPVDDPAMLAADGQTNIAICVASHSESGSIKLGNTLATTGANDLQFGVVRNTATGESKVVPPAGGAIVGAPTEIPGGLLGLMCPSGIPVVTDICKQLTDNSLNRVVATVQSAGTPRNFDVAAGMQSGKTIVDIPVRIHLENPFLGSKCFIGTTSDPVVLRPQNLTQPAVGSKRFDADGTGNTGGLLNRIELTGNAQGDAGFAVPGVSGCGPLTLGELNWAVNLKTALPSAAGKNNLVLNNAATYTGGLALPGAAAPNAGRLLSESWHAGVAR
ncbi:MULTISPECIES: hypothetical protein [unclassified Streptomyces]|uniref:hypothetical protein n=1 Tax=unclassified Streptomyces TaxID=2593676 RepID=UPI00225BA166|nr:MULTISPECIES: hypothetical protein [unclassified Streptomyces]MCX4863059.1 hypothetical protein [Streptomyces sp. NBC_00906]MCX4894296.1 hypothetical protein [Streptomyces sp. NBC_00892]